MSFSSFQLLSLGAIHHSIFNHLFGVKRELTALADAARERGAQLALFGHTHVQCLETIGGVTLLNPGAAGRFGRSGCGVVTISGGTFECRLETDTE